MYTCLHNHYRPKSAYQELKAMDFGYHFTTDDSQHPFRGKGVIPPLFTEFMDTFSTQNINIEVCLNVSVPPIWSLLTTYDSQIKENDNTVADIVWKEIKARNAASRVVVSSRYGPVNQTGILWFTSLPNLLRYCEVLKHFRSISAGQVATGACESESLLLVLLSRLGLTRLYHAFVPPTAQVHQMPLNSAGVRIASERLVQAAHVLGQKVRSPFVLGLWA